MSPGKARKGHVLKAGTQRSTTSPVRHHLALPPLPTLLIVVLSLVLVGVPTIRYALIPSAARAAGASLRHASVYVAPDVASVGVINTARATQVLGDRPIVVAVMGKGYTDPLKACDDIVKVQTTSIALVYLGTKKGSYPGYCAGKDFPKPHVVQAGSHTVDTDVNDWLDTITGIAHDASELQVGANTDTDRTPEVQELVLAFDSLAPASYPHGVPRRSRAPDRITLLTVALELLLLVAVLIVLFLLVRWLSRSAARLGGSRRALADRRTEVEARLSAAGQRVLSSRPDAQGREAVHQATAGQLYVEALEAVESARTVADLNRADELIDTVLGQHR